jgi:hypothetical protein
MGVAGVGVGCGPGTTSAGGGDGCDDDDDADEEEEIRGGDEPEAAAVGVPESGWPAEGEGDDAEEG